MENNKCYLCGNPLADSDKFCKNCGSKNLAFAEADAPEITEAPPQAEPVTPPMNNQSLNSQPPNSQPLNGQQNYQPPQYGQYGYPYPPYPPQYVYPDPNAEPPKGSPYRPIGPWAWVGINFLMCIPIVNLVMLIVWACGGSKNVTLKNYCRGYWLTLLISLALTVALIIFCVFLGISIGLSEVSWEEYYNAVNHL